MGNNNKDGVVEILYRDAPEHGARESWGASVEAGRSGAEDIQESVAGAFFGVPDPNGFLIGRLPNGVEIVCPVKGKEEDEEAMDDWCDLVLSYLEAWMPRKKTV